MKFTVNTGAPSVETSTVIDAVLRGNDHDETGCYPERCSGTRQEGRLRTVPCRCKCHGKEVDRG